MTYKLRENWTNFPISYTEFPNKTNTETLKKKNPVKLPSGLISSHMVVLCDKSTTQCPLHQVIYIKLTNGFPFSEPMPFLIINTWSYHIKQIVQRFFVLFHDIITNMTFLGCRLHPSSSKSFNTFYDKTTYIRHSCHYLGKLQSPCELFAIQFFNYWTTIFSITTWLSPIIK